MLGSVIRNARLGLGLTQSELAERTDIDVRTVLKIENHRGNPKLEVLFPLIRELDVDPNTLFYPERTQDRPDLSQFHFLLSQYSETETKCLLPICESVLSVIRANHVIQIKEK